jgi:exodeoxyribonuclease VII small subunit
VHCIDLFWPAQYRAQIDTHELEEKAMPAKKSFPFEESLARLESLVERMETGDLSLEESLKTFEDGIKLTRECQQALKSAEQKVKLLIEKNGEVEEQSFESDDDDA